MEHKASSSSRTAKKRKQEAPHELFVFRPHQISPIDYKRYDGHFDAGINMYPRPRTCHDFLCCPNQTDFFVYGGALGDHVHRDLWRFSIVTRKWTQIFGPRTHSLMPFMVAPLVPVMCSVRDSDYLSVEERRKLHPDDDTALLFVGDRRAANAIHLAHRTHELHILRPFATNAANVAESRGNLQFFCMQTVGQPPPNDCRRALLVLNGCLYVAQFCGAAHGPFFPERMRMYRLRLRDGEHRWECFGDQDTPLVNCYHATNRLRYFIVTDGEQRIVLLGTHDRSWLPTLRRLPVFRLAETAWQLEDTHGDPEASDEAEPGGYPAARYAFACVALASGYEAMISGGRWSISGEADLTHCWLLDVRSMRWRELRTRLERPLTMHAMAATRTDCVYFFGGYQKDQNMVTNGLQRAWLRVPRLTEICWQAMLAYWPAMQRLGREALLSKGVPAEFVQQMRFPSVQQQS